MNESNEDTKDSVQVCSILHVAHVGVRRVILVHIVHNGLNESVEGVFVVIHTFTSPFVRELLYQEVFSLQVLSPTRQPLNQSAAATGLS